MDMNLISYETVVKDLDAHPAKRIFWRSGWKWKGAGEGEVSRDPKDYPKRTLVCVDLRMQERMFASWKDALKAKFDWACVVQCDKNTDDEMHLNGLSVNDME